MVIFEILKTMRCHELFVQYLILFSTNFLSNLWFRVYCSSNYIFLCLICSFYFFWIFHISLIFSNMISWVNAISLPSSFLNSYTSLFSSSFSSILFYLFFSFLLFSSLLFSFLFFSWLLFSLLILSFPFFSSRMDSTHTISILNMLHRVWNNSWVRFLPECKYIITALWKRIEKKNNFKLL